MKKIIAMGAAVALAASMFAAEPAFQPSLAEFSGNASVTWGIDLGTKKTGFDNAGSANLKFNLFSSGDKTTSSDKAVWADMKIKTDGASSVSGAMSVPGASVDYAKFHIYDLYIGIQKGGDTQTGALSFTEAINAEDSRLNNVGPDGYTNGIVAGYGNDYFGIDVDFRSKPNGTNYYTNDYAVAAEVALKEALLSGFSAKGGVSYNFADDATMGYSGSFAYKIGLFDAFYLKPAAGYTGYTEDGVVKGSNVAGALILGWGDTADANPGVYFFDDSDKKVTPGLSVSYEKDLKQASALGTVYASFYLGSLVENLKAAADLNVILTKGADAKMKARAGVAYDVKVDSLTITPKAGMSWANEAMGKSTEVKVGLDVAGLVNNTVFSVEYASGNLVADTAEKGTVNFTAKISL